MKRIIKYNIIIICIITLILSLYNTISYAESEFTVNAAETITIQASNIHYTDAIWIIEDTSIAKITRQGRGGMQIGSYVNYSYSASIEGIKKGTTEIKLIVNDTVLSRATIIVTNHIQSINFEKTKIEIEKGKEFILSPIFNTETPDNIDTLEWKSSNPEIATVENDGKVLAKNVGTSTITVGNDNCSASIEVEVVIKLEDIEIDKTSIELVKGKTEKINVKYLPVDTTESKEVQWISSNENIVTVDELGNVVAVNNGEATIKAKVGNITKECKVKVISPLKNISFEGEEQYGKMGEELQALQVKYNPIDTTDDKKIEWSSENEEIATINENGIITCKNEGNVEITATIGEHHCTYILKVRNYVLGDVNGDGKVNLIDYTKILAHVKKTKLLTEAEQAPADVDNNEKINLVDYTKVLSHVKGTKLLW